MEEFVHCHSSNGFRCYRRRRRRQPIRNVILVSAYVLISCIGFVFFSHCNLHLSCNSCNSSKCKRSRANRRKRRERERKKCNKFEPTSFSFRVVVVVQHKPIYFVCLCRPDANFTLYQSPIHSHFCVLYTP